MLRMSVIVASVAAVLVAAGAQVALAQPWPGAGAGQANPAAGYPPVSFWKEEGVVGNNSINVMIDQNGTIYDIQYPGAGGVFGVGTRNEGYAGGYDTFPPFTSGRGQMHVNQMMTGIRVDGLTHWSSNPNGVSYSSVTQGYLPTSQTILSTRRLFQGGTDITITQYDFSPKLSTSAYPTYVDGVTRENKGLHVQRHLIRNDGASPKAVDFYFYGDWALNGGDGSDGAYYDTFGGYNFMVAYDNSGGTANSRSEYNPTTFSDYSKNVSIFLGFAIKVCDSVGSASGSSASASWRTLGSSDNGQGWIARTFTVNAGQTVEVDVLVAGGYKDTAGVGNVGDVQIRPAVAWFLANSMQTMQTETDQYWADWLNSGTTITTPDANYNKLFKRGLLATALHVDAGKPGAASGGAIIAGFHNGAYPYCWPRDAVYAAVTFARTGHFAESAGVYTWMRDVAFRDTETWGKGYWKQKYTTDGYIVWGAPQIDETAVFPWGLKWHYDATGDAPFLTSMYATVREAAITMTSSPGNAADLPKLNYNPTVKLMYSNNVWEDQYDFHIYSNANIVRGLDDAMALAQAQGNSADYADFQNRRNLIKAGLDARLDANAEQSDISQLGLVYPFQVYSPLDARAAKYIDRVNGVAPDNSNTNRGLINYSTDANSVAQGWTDLVNRYVNDGYWHGGPWFLSTLWYGLTYAERADFTSGKADIDNLKYRVDLLIPKLGPLGLGAEQIAGVSPPSGATSPLLYPNQTDFVLQTAWPNAWESMSTFVDALMAFADFRPDAPNSTLRIAPKLPTGWSTLTYSKLVVGTRKVTLTVSETGGATGTQNQTLTNTTGGSLSVQTAAKIPAGSSPCSVLVNGLPQAYTLEAGLGIVRPNLFPLGAGIGSVTTLDIRYRPGNTADWDHSGDIAVNDIFVFLNAWFGGNGDFDGVGGTTIDDIFVFLNAWFTACP